MEKFPLFGDCFALDLDTCACARCKCTLLTIARSYSTSGLAMTAADLKRDLADLLKIDIE
jgi:hypothetical protein